MSSVKHHIQFVRLGFGDLFGLPGRSLEFATDEMDTKTAQEVVKVIKEWGSFNSEKVASAIGEIAEVWKSKDEQITFRFGRDYFPVLYIRFPRGLKPDHLLSYKKCEQMILKTKETLGEADPAELRMGELADTLRAWWRSSALPCPDATCDKQATEYPLLCKGGGQSGKAAG